MSCKHILYMYNILAVATCTCTWFEAHMHVIFYEDMLYFANFGNFSLFGATLYYVLME